MPGGGNDGQGGAMGDGNGKGDKGNDDQLLINIYLFLGQQYNT